MENQHWKIQNKHGTIDNLYWTMENRHRTMKKTKSHKGKPTLNNGIQT